MNFFYLIFVFLMLALGNVHAQSQGGAYNRIKSATSKSQQASQTFRARQIINHVGDCLDTTETLSLLKKIIQCPKANRDFNRVYYRTVLDEPAKLILRGNDTQLQKQLVVATWLIIAYPGHTTNANNIGAQRSALDSYKDFEPIFAKAWIDDSPDYIRLTFESDPSFTPEGAIQEHRLKSVALGMESIHDIQEDLILTLQRILSFHGC